MNMQRLLILGLATLAAGAAAFLARGLLGGGTPAVSSNVAPPIETSEVLVAASAIQPGQTLNPLLVRWQKWPKTSIDAGFITHERAPSIARAVTGTVARAPLVAGEPLTSTKIVHSDSVGFMAATLSPGMRAVSIAITTDSGAGGFILPNDRVDVILTQQVSDNPKRYGSKIVLTNVRVLAVDQTIKQDRDQKVVLAKTATLELTPEQARSVTRAQVTGPISLALRPLSESNPALAALHAPTPTPSGADSGPENDEAGVTIIRYGVASEFSGKKE